MTRIGMIRTVALVMVVVVAAPAIIRAVMVFMAMRRKNASAQGV
jgi:hypothetical protein